LGRRPAIGTGFGTGSEVFAYYGVRGQFTNFVGRVDPHANVHNAYLQELLELGIPGGIAFFALPLLAFAAAIVFLVRGRREPIDVALVGTALAALAAAVFESILAGFAAMTLLAWIAFGGLVFRALSADFSLAIRKRASSRAVSQPA
jgi:O-antigen ligase